MTEFTYTVYAQGIQFKTKTLSDAYEISAALEAAQRRPSRASESAAFQTIAERVFARAGAAGYEREMRAALAEARAERDAALARAADSDARLVRALDAAKAAALAVLDGRAPGPALEDFGAGVCGDADCPLCAEYDDGLDAGDGLDAQRKGRATPDVRR